MRGFCPVPQTIAKANGKIQALARYIDAIVVGQNAQIDVGMAFVKLL